jgi:hypothetical protein
MPDAISGFTKNEIITAAVFPLGYSSSDLTGDLSTHLSVLFDDALIDFCKRADWNFLHTTATLSIGNAERTYSLSNASLYPEHIERIFITTTGKSGRITKSDYHKLIREDPESTNTGTPQYYAMWGESTLYWDRTTDQAYTATMLYKRLPPMVTDGSNYPIVPRHLQAALVLGVKWKVAADKGDGRASGFYDAYEKKVMESIVAKNLHLEAGEDSIEHDSVPNGLGGQPNYQSWLNRALG